MHPAGKITLALVLMGSVLPCPVVAQSLGDLARQQRQQQLGKKGSPAPKVITNDEIQGGKESISFAPQTEEPPPHSASKSADEWKSQIQSQKQTIANLRARIDRLASTIHYVQANRYWYGAEHNRRQDQKQDRVEEMQAQLDEQQQKLQEMQDAARKDGYGNAVYDP